MGCVVWVVCYGVPVIAVAILSSDNSIHFDMALFQKFLSLYDPLKGVYVTRRVTQNKKQIQQTTTNNNI